MSRQFPLDFGELCRAAVSRLACIASLLLWCVPPVRAEVTYTITFDDPAQAYVSYYEPIRRNLLAAGAQWAQHFDATAVLSIAVRFDSERTMSAGSTATYFAGTFDGNNVYEMRAAAKLLGHVPSDAPGPDAVLKIGAGSGLGDPGGYLQKSLWFDPHPELRTARVPPTRSDAYSAFLHELGHIFIFNGFLDPRTGQGDSATGISTFDRFVRVRHEWGGDQQIDNFYFVGPAARAVYGGDVPLTFGCYAHFGNAAPRPGTDLIDFKHLEVMNGVTGFQGTRYHLTPLDLAVCEDVGLPMLHTGVLAAAPAPPQMALPPPAPGDGPAPRSDWAPWPAVGVLMFTVLLFAGTLAAWRWRDKSIF